MARKKRSRSPEASLEPGIEGDPDERPSESHGQQEQDVIEPPAQRHKPTSLEICAAAAEVSEDASGGNDIDDSQATDSQDQTRDTIPPSTPQQPQIMKISASTMHDPHSGESARDRYHPPPLLSSLSAKRLIPLMPPPLARSCSVTALMRGSKDLIVSISNARGSM
jgi:hypothetical protein